MLLTSLVAGSFAPAVLQADEAVVFGGGQPEIVIQDCSSDGGSEPSSCSPYFLSPAIYIRHNPDGLTPGNDFMMYPMPAQTNWVYVRVHNTGNGTLNNGRVYLYFSKAGTGFTWPGSWVNNYNGGVPYGDEIGWANVSNLGPGGVVTVEIPWNNVPDPANYNDIDADHFCILARFVSNEDPMSYAEVSNVGDNVKNNNNIAQCNITIMRRANPRSALDITNVDDRNVPTRLNFDVPDEEMGNNVLQNTTVTVDLGPDLHALWSAGGQEGSGVTDNGDNTITINDPHAWIGGIILPPASRYSLHPGINFEGSDPTGDIYHWTITQYEEGNSDAENILIGGEGYTIWMWEEDEGLLKRNAAAGSELATALQLSAHPNPSSAATAIGFTLPDQARISLAIYDASGRLVRNLLSNTERNAGRNEVIWDGAAADGTSAPNGTYFYRLSTPMGSTEGQLKIVQ